MLVPSVQIINLGKSGKKQNYLGGYWEGAGIFFGVLRGRIPNGI